MMFSLLLLSLIGASDGFESGFTGFNSWVNLHGKTYESEAVRAMRTMIWLDNMVYVGELNALNNGITYKINKFGDLTHEEFKEMTSSPISKTHTEMLRSKGSAHISLPDFVKPPDSVDWRDQGAVTPVKNQGKCGACYSFSATGALEGQWFRKSGDLISLSEQQIMDCSWEFGNNGCKGGMFDRAFAYIIQQKGLDTEDSYPYQESESHQCKFKADSVGAKLTGYSYTQEGKEDSLKDAIAVKGPVSIAINAGLRDFQFYETGVYDNPKCDDSLNHGVLAVGYGTDQLAGKDFFLVKNSWGEGWGDHGYIKMRRNKDNQCGIASYACYPVV